MSSEENTVAREEALRRAIFDELAVDEGLLDAENALDFSMAGRREKHGNNCMPALMQQCLLLASAPSPSPLHERMLEEALTNVLALSSDTVEGYATWDCEALIEQLETLVTPQMRRNYEETNAYYEALFRGTKDKRERENERPRNTNQPSAGGGGTKAAASRCGDFVTAGQMLGRPAPASNNAGSGGSNSSRTSNGNVSMRPLGLSKRMRTEPAKPSDQDDAAPMAVGSSSKDASASSPQHADPRLKGIDPKLLETIQNEIIHQVDTVTWDQIAGLEHAKNTIKEIVIWPMLRPDIFTGLRGPPKGLLLFGPPGTGKTMIGKCIASQARATFFSISASSLTSKWVGEGEKLVRALFACARALQPSVIFIDEIDSLLTQRTDGEFEASRRIKTEFLVQFDGAATSSADRILVIGATNRPQELDEAARRRLVKRLYIPLPDSAARSTIIRNLLSTQQHSLSEADIEEICRCTEGYSGADVDNFCREAALGPIRGITNILDIAADQVRPIEMGDFVAAMTQVRASVSSADLDLYLDWNSKFGSLAVVKP